MALATKPFEQVTAISFEVVYLVETLSFFDQYQVDLEAFILADAVQGALNCGPGVFAETSTPPVVPMESVLLAESCTAQISQCTVLQTTFAIVVEESVSPEATAFLGYVRLSNEMPTYAARLPDVDRVEYLRPLLFPPVVDNDPETTLPPAAGVVGVDNNVNVSPYTIGAVLAVCVGGVAALGVWARNRQLRNEQHMQLLEDMSAADDGEGEAA